MLQISVPLVEGNWFLMGEEPAEAATRTQLMDVLRDIKGIMLKAHYHFDQDEVCRRKPLVQQCCVVSIIIVSSAIL